MDHNPPTAADYARGAADDAKRKAESLEDRIAELENTVYAQMDILNHILRRLNHFADMAIQESNDNE